MKSFVAAIALSIGMFVITATASAQHHGGYGYSHGGHHGYSHGGHSGHHGHSSAAPYVGYSTFVPAYGGSYSPGYGLGVHITPNYAYPAPVYGRTYSGHHHYHLHR